MLMLARMVASRRWRWQLIMRYRQRGLIKITDVGAVDDAMRWRQRVIAAHYCALSVYAHMLRYVFYADIDVTY